MGFAYITYGEELKCGGVGKWYIRHFGVSQTGRMKGFEDAGFEIKLPYGKNEQDLRLRAKVNGRLFDKLRKNDIRFVAADDFINVPMDFEKTEGLLLSAAFADDVLLHAADTLGIDLKHAEVVVKDGGDEKSKTTIVSAVRVVGNLSVCTERKGEMEPFLEDIYNETGLCAGCFSDEYSRIMRRADVVINCDGGYDKIRCFKKGILYIDVFSKARKLEEIKLKRRDINIVGLPVFLGNDEVVSGGVAEAALFAWCEEKNIALKGENIKEYALKQRIKYMRPHFVQSAG